MRDGMLHCPCTCKKKLTWSIQVDLLGFGAMSMAMTLSSKSRDAYCLVIRDKLRVTKVAAVGDRVGDPAVLTMVKEGCGAATQLLSQRVVALLVAPGTLGVV